MCDLGMFDDGGLVKHMIVKYLDEVSKTNLMCARALSGRASPDVLWILFARAMLHGVDGGGIDGCLALMNGCPALSTFDKYNEQPIRACLPPTGIFVNDAVRTKYLETFSPDLLTTATVPSIALKQLDVVDMMMTNIWRDNPTVEALSYSPTGKYTYCEEALRYMYRDLKRVDLRTTARTFNDAMYNLTNMLRGMGLSGMTAELFGAVKIVDLVLSLDSRLYDNDHREHIDEPLSTMTESLVVFCSSLCSKTSMKRDGTPVYPIYDRNNLQTLACFLKEGHVRNSPVGLRKDVEEWESSVRRARTALDVYSRVIQ